MTRNNKGSYSPGRAIDEQGIGPRFQAVDQWHGTLNRDRSRAQVWTMGLLQHLDPLLNVDDVAVHLNRAVRDKTAKLLHLSQGTWQSCRVFTCRPLHEKSRRSGEMKRWGE